MDGILILSGGLDSTTLLYKLLGENIEVDCLTFHYGQRHSREIFCSKTLVRHINSKRKISGKPYIKHDIIDMRGITSFIAGNSSLLNKEVGVPKCHYTEEVAKKTIVPNRNMIMLSIAAGVAEARGLHSVYYAAHAGDHAIYPDCRVEFLESLKQSVMLSTAWNPVELKDPFIKLSKSDIVRIGIEEGVPYELTHSCYNGSTPPCEMCPTCVERIEAFINNGARDPLISVERWNEIIGKVV
jgi:7-cyano-7-deazaguanine synthase